MDVDINVSAMDATSQRTLMTALYNNSTGTAARVRRFVVGSQSVADEFNALADIPNLAVVNAALGTTLHVDFQPPPLAYLGEREAAGLARTAATLAEQLDGVARTGQFAQPLPLVGMTGTIAPENAGTQQITLGQAAGIDRSLAKQALLDLRDYLAATKSPAFSDVRSFLQSREGVTSVSLEEVNGKLQFNLKFLAESEQLRPLILGESARSQGLSLIESTDETRNPKLMLKSSFTFDVGLGVDPSANPESSTAYFVDLQKLAGKTSVDAIGLQFGMEQGVVQLNTRGVSKEAVNRLSLETASRVLQETMPSLSQPVQVLSTGDEVRSIHGPIFLHHAAHRRRIIVSEIAMKVC